MAAEPRIIYEIIIRNDGRWLEEARVCIPMSHGNKFTYIRDSRESLEPGWYDYKFVAKLTRDELETIVTQDKSWWEYVGEGGGIYFAGWGILPSLNFEGDSEYVSVTCYPKGYSPVAMPEYDWAAFDALKAEWDARYKAA